MTFRINNVFKLIMALIGVVVCIVFANSSLQLPRANGTGYLCPPTQDYTSFGADYYTYQYKSSVDTAKGVETINENMKLLLNATTNTQCVIADALYYVSIIFALVFGTIAASTFELKKKEAELVAETEDTNFADTSTQDDCIDENVWKCPNCGKINQNYVGSCGCGEIKPNDNLC